MSEKRSAPKRAAEETERKKSPAAAVAVAAAIAAVLLAPCVLAAASDTIYPRTEVAGIAVGGMTEQEAAAVLAGELPAAYENASLSVTVDRSAAGDGAPLSFSIPLSDIHIAADPDQAAAAAYHSGRSGNFFTSGVAYASSLLLGRAVAPALSMDEAAAKEAVAAIAGQADEAVTECAWRIEGDTMYVTKPAGGYLLDRDALLETVKTAVAEYDLDGVHCALTAKEPVSVTMEEIYRDAHKEASNAYYDKTAGAVRDGDTGVDFDPGAAQALMDAAAAGEEFAVPITVTKPKITKEEMAKYLFRDALGSCTTNVSGSANRRHNVGLAAKSCNSVVLNPGEVFSYNDALGQRTAANGYLPAAAYLNGKTVDEYGGGICQISSTVYLAVLRSNLEIVQRTNHMFWPGYIPLGMDATVSWGGPDLKFRNNTDYPIKLSVTYANGKATCTVYGTNLTGNTAKVEYKTLSSTAYETEEKEDPTLAPGERRQEQNGYTGYKVVTYRCIYDKDGKLISRNEEARSTYSARNKIILVGPGGDAPVSGQPSVPSTPETPPSTPETPETPPEQPAAPETPVPETPAPPEDDNSGGDNGGGSADSEDNRSYLPDLTTAPTWESPRAG